MKNQILVFRSDVLDSPDKVLRLTRKVATLVKENIGTVVVLGMSEDLESVFFKSHKVIDDRILTANVSQLRTSASLLVRALADEGVEASLCDESSSGLIVTDDEWECRINSLEPMEIMRMLKDGKVPVIPGSFGMNDCGCLKPLGISGAETLSVGIASFLADPVCTIFLGRDLPTDLINAHCRSDDGRWHLSYQECIEMEVAGGNILSARVAELAEKNDIPLVLNTFNSEQEDLVIMNGKVDEGFAISAVISDTKTAKIAILGVPDVPGIAARIFTGLADAKITTEMIIQSIMRGQINDIAFLVKKEDIEAAIDKCRSISKAIGAQGVTFDTEIARVSLIGSGIANHPDIPSRMFSILAAKGINIEMIVASSISITCVVDSPKEKEAVDSLKAYFMNDAPILS